MKGYSAFLVHYYIGYIFHVVLTLDGVYHSMKLAKASAGDSRWLKEIKHSELQDCLLMTDKAYLSAHSQLELFALAKGY